LAASNWQARQTARPAGAPSPPVPSAPIPPRLTIISGGLERSDMNPEEQLQRLYVAGFDLQTFERFPKAVGVLRDNCLAFLVPGPNGLQILGNVGWRMGESLGPLVEREGRKVFVHKQESIEATPERVSTLERFRSDLNALLRGEEPIRQ
jgi:hypothetical protein